jgi:hypothetical protein
MNSRVGGNRLAYGQLGGKSRIFVEEGGIRVEDGASVERVALGRLSSSTYGLRVTNPAGSVIIDGTSDMFRIAATGTMQNTTADGVLNDLVNTTLGGLGA